MRVLIVSQYYWPETFRINETVGALVSVGADVSVLTGQPNYPLGRAFEGYRAYSVNTERHPDGYCIYRVPLVPRGRGGAAGLILNYFSFVVAAAIFGPWLLRGKRFDAVLVYAPSPILQVIPAIWIAWLKRASVLTWVQDLWPDSLRATGYVRNEFILKIVAKLVRWIYRKNDMLLVQSRAFITPVQEMAGHTPVIYYPNPGEKMFSNEVALQTAALKIPDGFNVVFAGNLGKVQALDTVLEAASLLRSRADIRIVLVGSGSQSEWLAREINLRGLSNVLLPGRFSAESMPAILAQASVLLVSLSRDLALEQTVPSKVQAYLAAGKPVIASMDGEGARIVQEAGAGIACPAEDARALADAIISLYSTSVTHREEMGKSGRVYYDANFDPDVLALRMLELLSCCSKVKIEKP